MNEKIYYAEDVQRVLGCGYMFALNFIKESGHAIKIGRRYALPFEAMLRFMATGSFDVNSEAVITRTTGTIYAR